MNTLVPEHPVPTFSAAALVEWESHAESILRGVTHALNNRAASMSALRELCVEPDYTASHTRSLLTSEVERLHELVDAVRSIGVPRGGAEAFEPGEAARSAAGVIALHAVLRDRRVFVTADAPPVRTRRWMFVRALIVLAGRVVSDVKSAPITLDLRAQDGWVRVTAAGAAADQPSPYLREAAVALGGEPLEDAVGFRVPTLAELRRREGR